MKATTSAPAKALAALAAAAVLCLGMLALVGCSGGNDAKGSAASSSSAADSADLMSGTHHAVITVEGYEPITVELNADAAPITVTNLPPGRHGGQHRLGQRPAAAAHHGRVRQQRGGQLPG